MIKFQQSQALNSHFESFWSIVVEGDIFVFLKDLLSLDSTVAISTMGIPVVGLQDF